MSNHSDNHKQRAETARLAKRLRYRREKGREKWEDIARAEGIVKSDGSPDPGLAYRIAYNEYEPKGQEVRDRLGLRKFCSTCQRGFRKVSSGARSLSAWVLWWRRLDPEERDRRIRREWEEEKR